MSVGYRHAKNRADHTIPMVPELINEVQKYIKLRDEKYPHFLGFWISSHGTEFTEHGWKHLVSQLSEKVGFNISAHKMRHAFATNFCRDGGDVREL